MALTYEYRSPYSSRSVDAREHPCSLILRPLFPLAPCFAFRMHHMYDRKIRRIRRFCGHVQFRKGQQQQKAAERTKGKTSQKQAASRRAIISRRHFRRLLHVCPAVSEEGFAFPHIYIYGSIDRRRFDFLEFLSTTTMNTRKMRDASY